MSDDLTTRLTRVLSEHWPEVNEIGSPWRCVCGHTLQLGESFWAHVAPALAAEFAAWLTSDEVVEVAVEAITGSGAVIRALAAVADLARRGE